MLCSKAAQTINTPVHHNIRDFPAKCVLRGSVASAALNLGRHAAMDSILPSKAGLTLQWADKLMQVCAFIGLRDTDPDSRHVYHRGAECRGMR